jgi:hypothetical protein
MGWDEYEEHGVGRHLKIICESDPRDGIVRYNRRVVVRYPPPPPPSCRKWIEEILIDLLSGERYFMPSSPGGPV